MENLGRLKKYINKVVSEKVKHKFYMRDVDERFSWVMDGEKYVALLDKKEFQLDLWRGVAEELSAPSVPKYYHAPYMMGARMTLVWWLNDQHVCSDEQKLSYSDSNDGTITIRVEETFSKGIGWHEAKIFWSDEFGRYVVDIRGKLKGSWNFDRQGVEFVNLYPFGIFDDRPEYKRYQRSYFSGKHCGQVSFAHNPLVPYLTCWRKSPVTKLAEPYEELMFLGKGDYFGFGIEEGFNPFAIVAEDSLEFERATCNCLQDEHFLIAEDELKDREEFYCHLIFTYLNRSEAEKLADDSKPLTFDKGYPEFPAFPPDDDGIIRAVNPLETNMRSMWFCGELLGRAVKFISEGVPNGKGELIVQGPGENYSTIIYPCGTSFHLHPDKKHIVKLKLQVDGDNTFGKAWISQYLFRVKYSSPRTISPSIKADGNWHKIELVFYPERDCDFWNLYLEVTGAGKVHFSDFEYTVE